ncbi:SGNH/GDSL hydrolase family protein [Youxingia wuxianensis]|uniref:SGNH/GDSL hydrolase family protein n=1 Tax=Youxingia wuxianensis TaxID=2763678 RepID=A0A926IIL7_9FIRM|nr:SGNH/GDSL hydrolase family protein [Youxingia wuxianensis]MBC8586335.1 SGNH/GDSL hydrolase family protein [Youxingia wuxianensis]
MSYINLFFNCVEIKREGDWYIPYRFTQEQRERYVKELPSFLPRVMDSSGIILDFITDQPEISFEYEADYFTRQFSGLDIYEDGKLEKSIYFSPEQSCRDKVFYRRRSQENSRITIYLPVLARMKLRNFSLGNYLPAVQPKRKLVAYGDSITQGMCAARPSLNYVARIARALDCRFLNQGVGGYWFNEQSLMEPVAGADIVTVSYGGNDYTYKPDNQVVFRDIKAYFEKAAALYPSADKYAITPIWREDLDIQGRRRYDLIRDVIAQTAQENGFTVILGNDLVPHDVNYYQDLTIHPNERGFAWYAQGLLKIIK